MVKFRLGLLGLTVASALAAFSANAADIYTPASPGGYKDAPCCAPDWAGFYFGANGGYGWDANGSRTVDVNGSIPFFAPINFSVPTKGPNLEGGFGGSQIGYNIQRGHFVFGVEADIQISDMTDTTTGAINSVSVNGRPFSLAGFGFNSTATSSVDWFGTVRGRLGYAWDSTLVYFTGGFAYGKVEDELTVSNNFFGPNLQLAHLSRNDILTGYVLGGGIEFKPAWGFLASPNWSVKAEYQYIDLGSDKMTGSAILGLLPVTSTNVDHAFQTVRVGLNYHIPTGYEPLK